MVSTNYLPDIAQGNDGSSVKVHAEYLSGTSGDMRIYVKYRGRGDNAYGSWILVKDNLGNEIHCVDGGFGNIAHAHWGHSPWTMAIIYTGETEMSEWFCTAEDGPLAFSFTRA
jgi:hypothetical protein